MLPLKVAFASATAFGVLTQIVGQIPAAVIEVGAICGGVAALVQKVVLPAGRLLRRATEMYDALEDLPEWMGRVDGQLKGLERTAVEEIAEPVQAVKRELGVTARGDGPHTPDA